MTKEELELCKKCITSTMIGAIAAIEDNFGRQWSGEEDLLSDHEKLLKSLYQLTRQKILYLGNREIKKLERKYNDSGK